MMSRKQRIFLNSACAPEEKLNACNVRKDWLGADEYRVERRKKVRWWYKKD